MNFFLILTLALWGSAFAGIRAGLHAYSPLSMAILRFAVASLVLLPIFIWKKRPFPTISEWPYLMLTALFAVPGYHLTLNLGERSVTASSASLLLSTLPLWTVLWARLFLGEKLRGVAWLGFAISFVGAAIISFGEGSGFTMNGAIVWVLLSALSGSIFTTMQKKLLQKYSPFDLNCYVIWTGTLLMLPFSKNLISEIAAAPLASTGAVVYLGVFPAALAFVLWARVLQSMPASRAVSFLYLVPVFATLSGWLWLNEFPGSLSLMGGVFALMGVYVVNKWGRIKEN